LVIGRDQIQPLFGGPHPIEGEHEVLLFLALVAGEATIEVLVAVRRSVGIEGLEFPFAVALFGG
jgi:hypothetical protein